MAHHSRYLVRFFQRLLDYQYNLVQVMNLGFFQSHSAAAKKYST
jgi:hypothetical protein